MRVSEVFHVETEGTHKGHVTFRKSDAMTWRDYLVTLLHIAAEAEHGLMVQYLYAAYTLGGPHLDAEQAKLVAGWQMSILEVAKEEMGHLLTVQNLLALLGAPPNFTRAETSFEQALSPIPFFLEPLTRDVVASFAFAEMSHSLDDHRKGPEHVSKGFEHFLSERQRKRIDRGADDLARELGAPPLEPQPVARLYEEIVKVFSNREWLPDSELDELSYAFQASWDDWGRGYAPDPKLLSATGDLLSLRPRKKRASVLVKRAATRTEVIDALRAISSQGEAVHLQHPHRLAKKPPVDDDEEDGEPSHFERFLDIWLHYPRDWKPYRNVMINPVTRPSTSSNETMIEDPAIRDWAMLFNLRYRMLLTFLAHSFRLSRVVQQGEPNLRAMIMHRAFGEMYNLKTIAGLLVQMRVVGPKSRHGGEDAYAGPPFETPYTLNMPAAHGDAFRIHRDLFLGATAVNERIQSRPGDLGRAYLQSLVALDRSALRWIDGILQASATKERA